MSVKYITTIISVKLFFNVLFLYFVPRRCVFLHKFIISLILCSCLLFAALYYELGSWERKIKHTHAMEKSASFQLPAVVSNVWMRFSFCKYLNCFSYMAIWAAWLLLSSFQFWFVCHFFSQFRAIAGGARKTKFWVFATLSHRTIIELNKMKITLFGCIVS